MRTGLILLLIVATGALLGGGHASAAPPPNTNPFGVLMVKFAAGTSPQQMREAVTTAGADAITDLSALSTLAVLPSSADFATRIARDSRVRSVWADRIGARI